MNGIKEFFGVTEACQAFLEVDHTLVRINWPAEGGSMKGVCGVDSDIAQRPLHCVRGSVKELCELSLAGTQTLQVNTVATMVQALAHQAHSDGLAAR